MKKRFAVLSRQDVPLFDLDVDAMAGEGAVRMERLKGEHKLDVTTTQKLDEGMRILSRDGTLKWREWCVDEPQDDHDADGMLHAYGCTWSMQYDLATVNGGELWPGTYSPITAGAALAMVLGVQSRWEVGNVTVTGTAGTSLYDGQVWDYLGTLQDVWGGEMEPRIEVGADGVVHRYVDWLAHVGQTEATRRFDFGEDCTSIHRKEAPGPRFCRVVPRGGRDAQDADGIRYSDRCGVDEEPYREDATGEFVHPANAYYIEDTVAAQLFRTPDGAGGWHYPEKVVCYDLDLAGDQEELLNKAMAEVADHTRPKTTYEADVLQFVAAGMDAHGVALGDEVQIVDKKFGDVALRLQARIVEMTVNELDETDVHLVIGEPNADLASSFKSLVKSIDTAEGRAREIQAGGTIAYVESLLDAINAQIAADGGYTYLVNGQGNITYDKAVANPFVGAEATQVTQMKGGSLRFANSKKPAFQDIDDWDWKTVITSEGFLGLAATIAAITTGFIGSSDNVVFIDLDNRRMQIGNAATLGGRTVQQLLSDVDSAGVDSIEYGTSASSTTEPTTWSTTAPTSVAKGSWLWIRTTYKDGGTSTTKAYAGTDGQNGADGADGVGIASTVIEYGTSADAATQPSTWSTTPPTSLPQATWLWVRTTYTYSDQSTKSVYTKSYVGTDGEDGASVYVASSTKSGGATTVVLSDGTTLTIVDGEDGTNGTNGLNGYVHTAWANSADGSADFSTTVSANKLYLGVYTDNAQADSQSPSAYSWSLIKGADGQDGADGADGADGQDGADGIGIASITPQYYLSTSSTSATGGSWSSTPPTWSANHYIWTRSLITWDTTPSTTSTTTEVYDAALTQANQKAAQAIADAAEAAKVATNYLTFEQTNGLDVGYQGTNAKTRINGSGVEIFDEAGTSMTKVQSGQMRIGESNKTRAEIDWHSFRLIDLNGVSCFNVQDLRDTSGYATVEETWPIEEGSSAGRYILSATPTNTTYDVYVNSTRLTYGVTKYSTHFDISYNFGSSGTVRAVYTTTSNRATICTIGSRASGATLGIGSAAIGTNVTASGGMSHAEGLETKALNHCSHAEGYQTEAANVFAHAEGSGSKANGEASHAGGKDSKADGRYSFAHGESCEATGNYSIACGCQAKATSGSGSAAFGDGVTQSARGLACGGYNSTTDALFVVGSGTSSSNKRDAFYVKSSASYIPHGDLHVSGYVFDSSDRRLKKHVKYIDDDASEFIRKLRPALFEKDGSLQIGFYAQDVQNADEWGTSTVVETEMRSEELGFKPLTLNYNALIAPLVAYTQQLERRIDEQQEMIERLTKRLDALEGR